MARLLDNGDLPTRGVVLSQIFHHGRWGWLLEAPEYAAGRPRPRIDDYDSLIEALYRTHREAAAFERQLRNQRAADDLGAV